VRCGRWTARQDDALWLHTRERRLCIIEWGDFGIDPRLAHAAGDKLGDLRSEIDDQDGVRRARLCFGFWHAQPIEILARAVQLPPLSLTRYAAYVSKNDTRRAEIIQRLTDYVLAEGLSAASLRPLAKAAGTSDRMLLYYFADKRAIITAVLEQISARLVGLMSEQTASAPLPLEDLRRQLSELLFEDALWPYMRIWLQVAARAAMGDAFYRGVGEQIGRGFLDWGKMQLKADSAAQLEVDAARLLVSMEGMLFLKSIGLDDVNAKAL
jgi:AcrR family transcriptional regulator